MCVFQGVRQHDVIQCAVCFRAFQLKVRICVVVWSHGVAKLVPLFVSRGNILDKSCDCIPYPVYFLVVFSSSNFLSMPLLSV